MTVIERFLKLVSFDTMSSETTGEHPSTPNQKRLGEELVQQMQALGIQDARMDVHGYVYGTVPANCEKELPVYGLIAHMDTSPDAPGGPIRARITEPYDGGDIVLNEVPPSSQVLYSDNFETGFSAEDRVVAGDILISSIKNNF